MASTQNVKLGVCNIRFDGVDLGYTKGGVEVEVTTDTYKVMVDQFGESEINELITKRSIVVTAPLAETTVENMVRIMPGATLVDSGTKQVYTLDEAGPVPTTYTVTIDGVAYSYEASGTPDEAEILDGLEASINLSGAAPMIADASGGSSLVLTGRESGVTSTVTVSGGTLAAVETTPAAAGAKRVDVTNGVGTDLLSLAKELVIHPVSLPVTDQSEDLIIPLAATAGAVSFAYKLDEERVYNVEFTGYPDSTNNDLLFKFGDPAAA